MTSKNIEGPPGVSSLKMRRKAAQKLPPLKIEKQDTDSETWDKTTRRRYHSNDSGIETPANVGTSSDHHPSAKSSSIYPNTAGGHIRAVLIPCVAISPVIIQSPSAEHSHLLARSLDRSRSTDKARMMVVSPPIFWSPVIYGCPTCLVPYPSYICKPVDKPKLPQTFNVQKRNGRKGRKGRSGKKFNKSNMKKKSKRPQSPQSVRSVEVENSFS